MLALRHRSDPLPDFHPIDALSCHREDEAHMLAGLQSRPVEVMERRLAERHHAYVARLDGEPAAFGWVATDQAVIGELDAVIHLPRRHRYLWNFVTLPRYRGRGIYPRLLRAIIEAERAEAEWSWIMYAPENRASGAGIAKAGFTSVAAVAFNESGRGAFRELQSGAGVMVQQLLGLPLASGVLTPCWKCVRAGRGPMTCAEGSCHCDYQRPDVSCAA